MSAADVINFMKKRLIFLIILFLIFILAVKFLPQVTAWDRYLIVYVQNVLGSIPPDIARLAGGGMYMFLIFVPLIAGNIFFIRKYLIIDTVLYTASPFIAHILNRIIKFIVQRPRPDIELQIGEHSQTCSFPSSHTVITFCFWGLVIYYLVKYCNDKFYKTIGILFAIMWIIFEGFTRIWLGVHYPTDIVGGFILGGIFLFVYINLIKTIGGK